MRARTLRRAAERTALKVAGKATVLNEPTSKESFIMDKQPAIDQEPTVADEQPTTPAAEPSPARLAANRANAKLSTGPSPEGLAASCQNHTIHGLARHSNGAFKLLTSEDPAGFEALKQSLAGEYKAGTPTEFILVNAMAESHWLADRAQRLLDTCIDPGTGAITNEKLFSLYLRYQTTHKRSFHKSLSELTKQRSEKRKAEIGFEAQNARNDQNARKNALHDVDVHMKETDLLLEIVKYTNQLMAAKRENPNFAVEFAAELAKRGLPMTEREVVFTSAA
jgi:hypothetical protein